MYSTAHQAATRPSSHNEDEFSEGARKDFRPGHKTTLKCNVAHSDACGQTESESERAGTSSNRTRKKKSVSASSDPVSATVLSHLTKRLGYVLLAFSNSSSITATQNIAAKLRN